MHHRLKFVAALGVAWTLALPVQAQDASTVVATVNGTDITVGHMIVARASLPEQYQQLPAEILFTGILDQLIQQTVLQKSYQGTPPARVTLSIENETRSLIAGEVVESILAQPVSEDTLRTAYSEQYGQEAPSEEYNASHILVETEEEATAIKAELDAGADFAATAREKSTGPSGPGGGVLGWFSTGAMVKDFEDAVVALDIGVVSDPVQTQFGWHVIRLNEKRAKSAPEFDAVREELEISMRQEAVQTEIDTLVAGADVDKSGSEGVDPSVLSRFELLED